MQSAVISKMLYKILLDTGSDEARQRYNEAKMEARRAVRKVKNDEWVQLGREVEREAAGSESVQYGVREGCGPQGLERCHNCTNTQERE